MREESFSSWALMAKVTSLCSTGSNQNDFHLYIQFYSRQGFGLLHLGSALHGALPLQSGTRTNLIMWLRCKIPILHYFSCDSPRSSSMRNQRCPMCGKPPDLEPVMHGQGDGFTMPDNDIESLSDD